MPLAPPAAVQIPMFQIICPQIHSSGPSLTPGLHAKTLLKSYIAGSCRVADVVCTTAMCAKIGDEFAVRKTKSLLARCLPHVSFVDNGYSCTLPGSQLQGGRPLEVSFLPNALNLFLNFVMLEVDATIPDTTHRDVHEQIREKFQLNLTEEEAIGHF
ncbi:hypothetical protein F4604DRAFT_1283460 [Suillus subluteus]|nr:hypothetical protein F4604DRAFT_1283460 [Suillus subluteus]